MMYLDPVAIERDALKAECERLAKQSARLMAEKRRLKEGLDAMIERAKEYPSWGLLRSDLERIRAAALGIAMLEKVPR